MRWGSDVNNIDELFINALERAASHSDDDKCDYLHLLWHLVCSEFPELRIILQRIDRQTQTMCKVQFWNDTVIRKWFYANNPESALAIAVLNYLKGDF